MTGSASTEGQKAVQPLGHQAELLAEKMGEVRQEISKAIVGQGDVDRRRVAGRHLPPKLCNAGSTLCLLLLTISNQEFCLALCTSCALFQILTGSSH